MHGAFNGILRCICRGDRERICHILGADVLFGVQRRACAASFRWRLRLFQLSDFTLQSLNISAIEENLDREFRVWTCPMTNFGNEPAVRAPPSSSVSGSWSERRSWHWRPNVVQAVHAGSVRSHCGRISEYVETAISRKAHLLLAPPAPLTCPVALPLRWSDRVRCGETVRR